MRTSGGRCGSFGDSAAEKRVKASVVYARGLDGCCRLVSGRESRRDRHRRGFRRRGARGHVVQASGMRLRKRGWAQRPWQRQAVGGDTLPPPVDFSDGGSTRAVAVIQDEPEELHLRGSMWRLGVRDVTETIKQTTIDTKGTDRRKAQRVDEGGGGERTEAAARGRGVKRKTR